MTESGGGELSGFLTRLHEDPDLQRRYKQDPRGTMKEAGVSEEAADAVMSGDLGRIRAMLPGGPEQMLFMVVISPDG
jgi:hypothetical protein